MSLDVLWIGAAIDNPRHQADALESFWNGVLGQPDGDPHIFFRRNDGDLLVSPDLLVDDVDGATRAAVELGARVVDRRAAAATLRSPGGLLFSVGRHDGQSRRPRPAAWPAGASIADQICLDLPADAFEDEAGFWTSLTGWTRSHGDLREFDDLLPGGHLPMHFLLQRLDETGGPVRAHLDFACDDRDAEAERHRRLGAHVERRASGWTVMRDPAGRVYCVTDRPAGVEKHPR